MFLLSAKDFAWSTESHSLIAVPVVSVNTQYSIGHSSRIIIKFGAFQIFHGLLILRNNVNQIPHSAGGLCPPAQPLRDSAAL